jgi:hypothetical protein
MISSGHNYTANELPSVSNLVTSQLQYHQTFYIIWNHMEMNEGTTRALVAI